MKIVAENVIDDARFNSFHLKLLLWCALIIVFDGYDLAVVGIALPKIMEQMHLTPTFAGVMVSSALVGMMLGNLSSGALATRFGRRRSIVLFVALFSLFTAVAGASTSPTQFVVARFLAGIGIGGVMPNVIAQMTEYSPKRVRSLLVTLMFSGYSVGGVLAASLGKGVMAEYGWSYLFFAAGVPLLLLPLLFAAMPESALFLWKQEKGLELKAILRRVAPDAEVASAEIELSAQTQKSSKVASVPSLFSGGKALSSVMLWVQCFMCLFMVYALSSWLAKMMASAGYSLGSALTFIIVLNAGGIVGAIGGGWLADKLHIKYVLASMYLVAALSISVLGLGLSQGLLYVFVALAGASTIGTQIVGCAYAGQFYPNATRATGVGWMLGMGRLGAMLSPLLIGFFVEQNFTMQANFILISSTGLIASLAVLAINHSKSASHERERRLQVSMLGDEARTTS
ncbi:MFS transporter [Paraburkholderia caffeinilytica]|uniref:MFS transporter n=1 Tax=Paraburkholderia caffeinilytica TaxID=1761016 RepID=UPI0038BCF199